MSAMKRPSDVPPVVETSGVAPRYLPHHAFESVSTRRPRVVRKGRPPRIHSIAVVEPVAVEHGVQARLEAFDGARRGEAEIEVDPHFARDDVERARAGVDVGHLPRGRREMLVALVPCGRREFREGRGEVVDRVLREVRIGHVPLDSLRDEAAGERAAPPVLDGVAEVLRRRGLAHDAVVDALASRLERFHHAHGAVDRGALFVGGEQECQRAGVLGVRGDELFGGDDEGRDRGLHVGRAARVQPAVHDRGDEGIGVPLVERPRRHHVGVPGEDHQRPRRAAADPQVRDLAAADRLRNESQRGEPVDDHLLAALVGGRDRRPREQRAGQVECGVRHRARAASVRVRRATVGPTRCSIIRRSAFLAPKKNAASAHRKSGPMRSWLASERNAGFIPS